MLTNLLNVDQENCLLSNVYLLPPLSPPFSRTNFSNFLAKETAELKEAAGILRNARSQGPRPLRTLKRILLLQLDLALKDESGGDISSFITNGEWDLIGN